MLRTRIRIISLGFLVFALFLFVKLYSLQIIHADDFAERADHQYQRPSNNLFSRGTIYFQDKNGGLISAGSIKSGFTITINPKVVQKEGIDKIYTKLSAVLEFEKDDFIQKANKQNSSYAEIKKRVDEDTGKSIAALKIPGVGVYKESWRYYPGNSLAAHTLGFLAFNKENEYGGRYGLERYYDQTLNRDTDNVYVNFFAEIFSNFKKKVIEGDDLAGDIVTTIEPTTQSYLETTLKGIMTRYSSQSAGAIIMDPKTGEIYAMALAPSFDPNNLKEQKSVDIFQNDLVENVYEMGSIIKPLTMAVGIDTGKVTAQSTYNDEGSVTLSGKTMYNFDKKGRGVINYQLALAKSLNTGFIHIAQLVGNETMSTYFKKFALGEKTGIDLPNEGSGLISTLDRNIDVEIATAAFGQGIAMTPIETARALSTIANGGYLVTPHVVKKVDYRVGYTKTIEPKIGERVIKESTATAVTDMLINNVDTSLLDGKAKNAHYAVAAKTGTAQMRGPGGTYYDDRYLHSFVGFLPAKEPRFLVFMYTINPRGVQYASETLAQPFIDLTKFLINYYQLPPDR
ncbi:MAG: hypothetical protein RL094_445 [Candidatus Parcubacteria bacterium]|jgi:cell division protein FtsI/penicillin-binding protein 2